FFGVERVDWFNGGLFADADALVLERDEVKTLIAAGKLDWSLIEPAIFGTLFERGLDPAQRSALGAHFTSRSDIERLVEPVVMAPLRREAMAARAEAARLLEPGAPSGRTKAMAVHEAFLARLRGVRVLDPACGSGNFLYIALRKLKDLEYDQTGWASVTFGIPMAFPQVGPEAVLGIEVNPYAAELARIAIWIGEIQWHLAHGFAYRRDPVLRPLDGIECRDALLDLSDPASPREAEWPPAEFIVGNPPFLGGKMMRRGIGDAYVDQLFGVYDGRVPREADLVTYWHEKARSAISAARTRRAGLLANQSIRSGASRKVLERIKESGDIFYGLSDEPWVLAGASVHISMVGQDDGSERDRHLDGLSVLSINPDLTTGLDLTVSRSLRDNLGIAFMGDTKGGAFEIDGNLAAAMLAAPNPDGRSNAAVIRPWVNGDDINGRPLGRSIIDFGVGMSQAEAALYEAPYEYIRRVVQPERSGNRRPAYAERWWLHVEPRSGMRAALEGLDRCVVTTRVAPHRLFAWLSTTALPDSRL
ncbi:MAG: DNA methyltransferase, partial [Verrucomicrobiota bacterium]